MTARPKAPVANWEKIGPAEASEILEHNTHNLPMRNRLTMRYAEDMSAGNWARNGETVKIADNGTLLDGQHRLAAVVLSGTAQEFLVVRGLPMEAQRTVDSGRMRALGTVLTLDGIRNATTVGSIGRRALAWEGGARRDITRPNVDATPTQVMIFLAEHPEIEQVHAPRAMRVRAMTSIPPTMLGLASWLFERIDPADADDFFDRLSTGANMDNDHPIMGLRRIALTHNVARKRQADWIWLALLIKAWNLYRAGETVQLFTFKVGGATPERFPEPK